MISKKGTKAYRNEVVRIFYGVNRDTLEVESVSLTRDGDLSRWNSDDTFTRHHVIPGRDARSEVRMVFGLIEVREALVLQDSPMERIRAEVEQLAHKMRQERKKK